MNEIVEFYTAALPLGSDGTSRLLEEIAFLEARLAERRGESDCAYERSLARSYEAVLRARRSQLAGLSIEDYIKD